MAIKLVELYNSCDKRNFKLIAGEKGLNNIVSWIHMVEGIEISVFVEQQELSFTTGIALKDEDELFELVKCSYNSKASGFVINIGPFIKEIPKEIIEFCHTKDFPLFEMPWHVYLAEIMRRFCYQITLSDRIDMELSSAIKNAIFFPSQKDIYLPQLEQYGVNEDSDYIITLIEISDKKGNNITDLERENRILKKIENILMSNNSGIFCLIIENRFVFLFENHTEKETGLIFKKNIKKIKESVKNNERILVSIGNKVKNISNISDSYKKALSVLKMQKRKTIIEEIMLYKELGIHKLLLSVEEQSVLKDFYEENLGAILKCDEMNGTDYFIVLKSYLENNGSIKAVSEELFYHKNTICYKINKIQELIGASLSELKVRVNLSLAMMIKEGM